MKQNDTTARESSTEIGSKTSATTVNWKRLEQKYLDYIDLLKSKIAKTERKLAHEARSSSVHRLVQGFHSLTRAKYASGFCNIRTATQRPADTQRQS